MAEPSFEWTRATRFFLGSSRARVSRSQWLLIKGPGKFGRGPSVQVHRYRRAYNENSGDASLSLSPFLHGDAMRKFSWERARNFPLFLSPEFLMKAAAVLRAARVLLALIICRACEISARHLFLFLSRDCRSTRNIIKI